MVENTAKAKVPENLSTTNIIIAKMPVRVEAGKSA
jgi:hypothetical protein